MRSFLIVAIFCVGICSSAFAQEPFSVGLIKPELTASANIVKRMEEMRIQIEDIGKAYVKTTYALTVLNKAGDDAANLVVFYDKLKPVKSIEGKLFDADGKKVKSLKKSDINDYSGTEEGTLADDNRYKHHSFNYNIYPYTVYYEVEEQYNGIFYLPMWLPASGEHYSVEQSRLIVECPADYTLRYKSFNYSGKPQEKTDGKTKSYEWNLQQFPGISRVHFMPPWYEATPSVFLAPGEFVVQDYKGNMNDWAGFGKFIYELNENRDVLPAAVKDELHAIADPIQSRREKINAVYRYLQQNTRYISVQLGIGGWQTFDANYVAQKKYGDCKALSNYMYSLLKEVGILSYYTLIYSDREKNKVFPDFPSSQFNHIIVCVPDGRDTVWLECTSQSYPAGYLGNSNSNRPVLLIDKSGGTLVRTPAFSKNDNALHRKVTGSINPDGHLTMLVQSTYQSARHEYYHGMIHGLSKERVADELKDRIDLPSFNIDSFHYEENHSLPPVVNETLKISANNYASKTGKRMFITPNIIDRFDDQLKETATRKYPIRIMTAISDIDTAVIQVPDGFTPESIPAAVKYETIFGSYQASVEFKAGQLIYYRRYERNDGEFPASAYNTMVDFYNKMYRADRARVVLVKNE